MPWSWPETRQVPSLVNIACAELNGQLSLQPDPCQLDDQRAPRSWRTAIYAKQSRQGTRKGGIRKRLAITARTNIHCVPSPASAAWNRNAGDALPSSPSGLATEPAARYMEARTPLARCWLNIHSSLDFQVQASPAFISGSSPAALPEGRPEKLLATLPLAPQVAWSGPASLMRTLAHHRASPQPTHGPHFGGSPR